MTKYKNCNDSGWQDSLSARLLLNQSLSLKNYFTVRNLCKKFCCFTDFLKNENLQNIKKFCESQFFFAKYAVLHRKLQYLKEKWCSSPKIILQNVSSQTWLQPSCDKKNHPGTQKQTFFGLAKTLRWNYPGLQNYILWKLLLSKLQNHFQAGIID